MQNVKSKKVVIVEIEEVFKERMRDMSVFIKKMDKPKCCEKCMFCMGNDRRFPFNEYKCQLTRKDITYAYDEVIVDSDCPLIEVKAPHGRLTDVDEMIKDIRKWVDHPDTYIRNRNKDFIYFLENSDTVIEAEVLQ